MNIILTILIIFFSFFLLYFGKFLLLPLFLALFIYIIIKSLSKDLIKIGLNFQINLNKIFSIILIFLFAIFVCYFSFKIFKINLNKVISNVSLYQQNLENILNLLSDKTLSKIISTDEIIRKIDFLEIFTEFLNFLTNFAGNFSLVLIYLIFFVFEEKFFEKKLKEIANNKKKLKVFEQINDDIYNYFRIKIFTSFFTGILTFLILFILKNDLSTVFGIFSFFLNFIPYIGSLLSVLLPTIFSYVQFLDPINCSLTFFSLLVTQIFLGNFIEPKLMSKSLNLSPVILMLFLSLMGKLWGVSGMFLSVPTLVVLLIIFNNFKETKKIAIFLSEKGINKNL